MVQTATNQFPPCSAGEFSRTILQCNKMKLKMIVGKGEHLGSKDTLKTAF